MLAKRLLDSLPNSIRVIRKLTANCLEGALTLQQLRVLLYVREGAGQTLISDALQISKAAVSKSVDALVGKGLIQKSQGVDRRSFDLKLTPSGAKILNQVLKQVEKKIESRLALLTAVDKKNLGEGLKVLDKLTDSLKEV